MTLGGAAVASAVVAVLLTTTPGPDTALVLRAAITGSRGQAFATAAGVITGVLARGAAAAVAGVGPARGLHGRP